MATTTITGRTAVTTGNLTGAAVFPVDDANANTRKATLAQLRTNLLAGGTGFTAADPFLCGSARCSLGLDFGSAAYPLTNVTTSATIGANGGASALTANPVGYIVVTLNGAGTFKIPYYNN